MLDETDRVCSAVQIQYLLYPTADNLSALYKALLDLTNDLVNIYKNKKKIKFRSEYKKQLIHDASTEMIEKYLKNDSFYVKTFKTYQMYFVRAVMGCANRGKYRKERNYEESTISYNP